MEGIRGEVSNKIRSAIKAKLAELGAYVDDELPDYIMVMVANKRSRQQMEDDLQLFLGDSTTIFTAWLHSVLNKLQQVTVNSCEMKNSSEKKRVSSEDLKKDKKKKSKRDKETDKVVEKEKSKDDAASKDILELNESAAKAVKTIKIEPPELPHSSEDGTQKSDDKVRKTPSSQIVSQIILPLQQTSAKKHNDTKTTEDEDEDFINLKADIESDMWGESEENPPSNNTKGSQPSLPKSVASPISFLPPPPLPPPQSTIAHISDSQSVLSVPSAISKKPVDAKAVEPKPAARIIKISEALRQEQETLNPTKHPSNPQKNPRKNRIPSPIIFHANSLEKEEDDEQIFGQHIAYELKQLSQGQRSLAKLKIQQALIKRVLLSHVVNQKISPVSEVRQGEGRSIVVHNSESTSRRFENRGADLRDLRQTLNKGRRKERGRESRERGKEPIEGRSRERDHVRERERDRKYSVERNTDRKLQSSLLSIVRPKPQLAAEEDEEEEGKTDASVASVVRVKPRPRLPSALQANRSLILKAVAEAQKSVHKFPLRHDPALKAPSANQKAKLAAFSNGASRTQKQDKCSNDQLNLKTRRSEDNEGMQSYTRMPPRTALMKMSVTVPRETTPPMEMDVAGDSENGSVVLDSPLNIMIQVPTSPLAPESAEHPDPAQTEKVLKWMEGVEEASKTEVLSLGNETLDEQPNIITVENDLETEFGEIGTEQNNLSTDDCEESFEPELVDESNDHSLDRAAVSQWSDDGDPQFVVTLDGLDPNFIESFDNEDDVRDRDSVRQTFDEPKKDEKDKEKHAEEEEIHLREEQEMHLRAELLKQQAAARENQLRQQLLKQQVVSKEQKTAGGTQVETSPAPVERNVLKRSASPVNVVDAPPSKVLAKNSTPERCKFWPTCRHGDKCDFYHPSVPCKLFPNCKFADRCLYIHPNCKFNSSCTRLDCPYTHFGPRPAMSTSSSTGGHPGGQTIKQTCKFYPNCNNRNCLFIHPTVCRFGMYCTKSNCQFIHTDKALPTKHKWVRV